MTKMFEKTLRSTYKFREEMIFFKVQKPSVINRK